MTEYQDVKAIKSNRISLAYELIEKRAAKMGEGVKYYKEGATAYCWFDSFLCDDSGWRKFYKGEAP